MMERALELVHQVGKMNFQGNIIPHNWFGHLRHENGKPNTVAIVLLSEIVYWYRPILVKDEATGQVIGERKKFKADKLQRSYASFAEQFGFTKRQAKDAVKFLVDAGVITTEFRHITTETGQKLANVLFIEIVPKKLEILTYVTLERHTYDDRTVDVYSSNGRPMPLERQTNTESTTETTTKTTTERETPPPEKFPVEKELALLLGYGRGDDKGIADPAQDLEQYMQYRDAAIQAFVDGGGDMGRKQTERNARREAIIGFVNSYENFNLERWVESIRTCIIGGVGAGNVACMFDTYLDGGNYQEMCRKRKGGNNGRGADNSGVHRRVPKYTVADPARFGPGKPPDNAPGEGRST